MTDREVNHFTEKDSEVNSLLRRLYVFIDVTVALV